MNCELNNAEIWLINSSRKESQDVIPISSIEYDKSFFLTVSKVSYGRESTLGQDLLTGPDPLMDDPPTHMLAVHNLRGSWTLKNRNLIFALIEAYQKSQLLKRNLSTEALKSVKVDHYLITPVVRELILFSVGVVCMICTIMNKTNSFRNQDHRLQCLAEAQELHQRHC